MMHGPHCAAAFADVDASGEADRLADYLRAASATDVLRDGKREAIAALGLRPGARALDVGCGLGDEVRAMAALVAPGGRAVGVDTSRRFLEHATALAEADGVAAEFVLADAHTLPFEDGSFDAIRCERTLQHLADPGRAVREMARVAAPGAIVALSEPDWDTLVIDLEPIEVTAPAAAAFRTGFRNPTVGRTLLRLAADAGLRDIAVQPGVVFIGDVAQARSLLDLERLVSGLVECGSVENAAADAWLAEFERRGVSGTLFIAATGFFVTARKPA